MRHDALAGDHADYFSWLMDQVGGDEWWSDMEPTFVRLLERKYYWTNEIDSGIQDKIENLRVEALYSGIRPSAIPIGEVSVLEVLVYLAKAIDTDIMYDPAIGTCVRTPEFFNDMVIRLGFNCDADFIDSAIDDFLSGDRKISHGNTLWEQVNDLYSDQFMIESEEPWMVC